MTIVQPQLDEIVEANGAVLLSKSLKKEGVNYGIGLTGGAALPTFDQLAQDGIPIKDVTFESSAVFAAETINQLTGQVIPVLVTSGPGAGNAVTGAMNALKDRRGVVVITGQVATTAIGTDAFQEADTYNTFKPNTKAAYLVKDPNDIPRIVREAFRTAGTGARGPVLIDMPKDVAAKLTGRFDFGQYFAFEPMQPRVDNTNDLEKLIEVWARAKRPVLYIGGGVITSGAAPKIRHLAEITQTPVTSTVMALGAMPYNHPLYLRMLGMHGTYYANMAVHQCDLLIAVGARFDDRVTSNVATFAPNAQNIAHFDIEPTQIGRVIGNRTNIRIYGDAKQNLSQLIEMLGKRMFRHDEWLGEINRMKRDFPLHYDHSAHDEDIPVPYIVQVLGKYARPTDIIVTDVGRHQMWTGLYYPFENPNTHVTSAGLGAMGFGTAAAIGAKLARPNETIVALVGNGGGRMTIMELQNAYKHGIPIKVLMVDDGAHGMVKQWHEIFFEDRYVASLLNRRFDGEKFKVDYAAIARAQGFNASTVNKIYDLEPTIARMMRDPDEPYFLHVYADADRWVLPMIKPGEPADKIVLTKPKK